MPPKAHKPPGEKNDTEGERIYQDHFGDFFLRVIWRFISHLETILKTIFQKIIAKLKIVSKIVS